MADHITDLNPEGGNRGGNLSWQTGTPEWNVKQQKESYTGKFLGPVLEQTKFMKAAKQVAKINIFKFL